MDPRDHIEIQQLYAKYCHKIDSADFAGWAALFTPDGVWQAVDAPGGEATFSVRGRDDLETFAREDWVARGSGTQRHWMGNILVEGESPHVRGRTYGFLIQSVDGEIRWIAHGDFDDDLVKTAAGWRFGRRSIRPLGPSVVPSGIQPSNA
jgi:hypothetical protein